MALTKKEKEILSQVAKKPAILKTAPSDSLKKKQFIKEAVAMNPKAIKYADSELLGDFTFLEKLVATDGMVAAYVPAKYAPAQLFLTALENTFEVEPFIPNRVYKEMSDGMVIETETPYIIYRDLSDTYRYRCPDLIKNKNNAIFISKHFITGFFYCGAKKYSADRDVALAAVLTSAHNYHYIDDSLKNDAEIIKCAYRNNPAAFVNDESLAPYRSSLVNDRDFIKDCLSSYHVCVLEPEYADDREIALLAIRNAISNRKFDLCKGNYSILSDRLKMDDEIIKMVLSYNGQILDEMPACIRDNDGYVTIALKNSGYAVNFISERLLKDSAFVWSILKELDGDNFFYVLNKIESSFLNDPKLLELAEKKDYCGYSLLWNESSDELCEFLMQLFENITENPTHMHHKDLLEYLPNCLRNDALMATMCIQNNPEMYLYVGDELKDNAEFALSLMIDNDIDISEYLSDKLKCDKNVSAYLKRRALKERLEL